MEKEKLLKLLDEESTLQKQLNRVVDEIEPFIDKVLPLVKLSVRKRLNEIKASKEWNYESRMFVRDFQKVSIWKDSEKVFVQWCENEDRELGGYDDTFSVSIPFADLDKSPGQIDLENKEFDRIAQEEKECEEKRKKEAKAQAERAEFERLKAKFEG